MNQKEDKKNKTKDEDIKINDEKEGNIEILGESDNNKEDEQEFLVEEELAEETGEEENTIEEKLNQEIEQLKDEKLRLLAEMDNLRKRSERDRVDLIKYGSFNLARDILSPDDNLTRALDSIPSNEKKTETVNKLIDGLKMVQKEFSIVLEKYGVKKIEALDKKFDHNLHQAMVEIDNDEVEPGIVVQEMQSGYIMHDRLLRPSMVGLSKKMNKNDKDEEKDGELD